MSHLTLITFVALAALLAPASGHANALNDWNARSNDIIVAARMPTPPALRTTAILQTAVYEAVNAITGRYPGRDAHRKPAAGASVDAAIAAANHSVLAALLTGQAEAIDAAYRAALAGIPDGAAKTAGIAVGEKAAADVLALRAKDGAGAPESYRPRTTPGAYVPTVTPAATQWPQRMPWALTRADQFRPAPPVDLKSARWAKDYNEIQALGAKDSARRTAAQTEIAKFWEMTGPSIYFPVVRSVTSVAGRDVTQSARLLAMAAQAMDDAAIAVFDAKYHYRFWRPITAIRNGDIDDNDATVVEPAWQPFIETPMHPEYPCAHCTIAAAVGAVVQAELGRGATPRLSSSSPTAGGATHSWDSVDAFIDEVSSARVYDGVHYRFSTEAGADLGRKVGAEVVKRFVGPRRGDRSPRRSQPRPR